MLIKTGSLALLLLLASRLTGLWRESAQAAAFGATGMGDVAVLMLTFPDWVTGMLASGALAYVLVPHWATQTPAQRHPTQRQIGRGLLLGAVVLGLLIAALRQPLTQILAGGLAPGLQLLAQQGLVWSALALPAACMAALGIARLQFESDFVGMYSANLVVNCVLIVALSWLTFGNAQANATPALGLALCAAMGLRMVWVFRRIPKPAHGTLDTASGLPQAPLPMASVWLWAALAAGLPLALPLVARSMASVGGEGALSTFNYAWKLVELPLVLAIQLVATLAFPTIARAMASGHGQTHTLTNEARQAVRGALLLAWTLACAAVAALQVGAAALASLLFGWGRMPAERLADIATWSAIGAWGLLPQAVIAVALMVLAAQRRLRLAAVAYAGALLLWLVFGRFGTLGGTEVMWALNGVLCAIAVVMLSALVPKDTAHRRDHAMLPLRAAVPPTLALAAIAVAVNRVWRPDFPAGNLTPLWLCLGCGLGVVLISFATSREFRLAVQR